MRGLLLGAAFFALVPLIFLVSPYVGILMWFWVSLMSPQKMVWMSIFASFNFALIVAICTLICWVFSREEPRFPPPTRTTILLISLMIWVSITSLFGIGPPAEIYMWWGNSEKMLLMTLLAYAWTNTKPRLDWLIVVCVLSVTIYGVRGGLGTILHGGGGRVYGPDDTMIGDNNDLGVALTMMLPMLLYLARRYQNPYIKLFIQATIMLTVIADLFTYSRGALVALCAMGITILLRSRQKIG
jgi:probable O-glycosylation ligase (exosortase A-associated)